MADQHPDDATRYADGSVEGVALSLSGGGYRAMMFHVGALQRLDEVGLLAKLACISSVSGGSITAAALALCWERLDFQPGGARNFGAFVGSVRAMADTSVDVGAVIGGILLPGSIGDRVAEAYDRVLFHGRTLQDLPDEGRGAPRFVMNATNVQSGALWRFSRTFMGDYRVGGPSPHRARGQHSRRVNGRRRRATAGTRGHAWSSALLNTRTASNCSLRRATSLGSTRSS